MVLVNTAVEAGPYGGSVLDGEVSGYVVDSEKGRKFNILVGAIIQLLINTILSIREINN